MMNEQPHPADWSGASDRTSEPHRCPYRLKGAMKRECIEDLSGKSVGLNSNGCCGTWRGSIYYAPCNFVARRCRKCLDEGCRGAKANAVIDVDNGLCEEHANVAETEIRIPADPRAAYAAHRLNRNNDLLRSVPIERPAHPIVPSPQTHVAPPPAPANVARQEGNADPPKSAEKSSTVNVTKGRIAMAELTQLTPRSRESLRDLTAEERKVVDGIVYKRDLSTIDTQLLQDPLSSGKSLSDILDVLFHRFALTNLPREDQRRFALGKLYRAYLVERGEFDDVEDHISEPRARAEPERAVAAAPQRSDDVPVVSAATPTAAVTSEPKSADAEPPSVPQQHVGQEVEQANTSGEVGALETTAVREAHNVAKRVKEARISNDDTNMPSVRAIYDAVMAMSAADMNVKAIGEAFGQSEKSAGTWTYATRSLSKLAAASWQMVEGKWVAHSALVKIAKLPEKEQILWLRAELEVPVTKDKRGVLRRSVPEDRGYVVAHSSTSGKPPGETAIADDSAKARGPASSSVLPPNPELSKVSSVTLGPITVLPISEEAFRALLKAGMFKTKGHVIIIGPPNENGVSEARIVSFRGEKD